MEKDTQEVHKKETILLEWTAPEFVKHSRTWKWFVAASLVLATAFVYAYFTKDWFMAGVAIILFIISLTYQKREPKDMKYQITQLGFYINDKLYTYKELHSFWLVIDNDTRILNLIFAKKYLPQLSILLYGIDPVTLRGVLPKFLPEQEDRTENIIEKMSRVLKI